MQAPPTGLPAAAVPYWVYFAASGERHDVDPVLVAAICLRETEFGTSSRLDVKGPGGRGDRDVKGVYWGHGLMQIDGHWHADWLKRTDLNGTPLWKKPDENIDYAVRVVLKPAYRVLGDWRLATAAYNCGQGNVLKAQKRLALTVAEPTQAQRWEAADFYTTGRNYSEDVFKHIELFQGVSAVG